MGGALLRGYSARSTCTNKGTNANRIFTQWQPFRPAAWLPIRLTNTYAQVAVPRGQRVGRPMRVKPVPLLAGLTRELVAAPQRRGEAHDAGRILGSRAPAAL